MVGVAGRSKGCHTCRRRKIRCDERKPTCERCERTGRACEGYARGTIFLNQTGGGAISSRSRHTLKPADGNTGIQILAATPETYSSRSSPVSIESGPEFERATTTAVQARNAAIAFSDPASSLQNASLVRQLGSMCMDRFCPMPWQQGFFSLAMVRPNVLSRSKQEPVFLHAYNALMLSMPRKGEHRPDMVMQSRVEYGRALREMRKSIVGERARVSDQMLLACTILKQYELQELSPSSYESFDAHVKGHVQLVKMRGPENFEGKFGSAMLTEVRYLDALHSLSQHKRSELLSSEWRRDGPWKDTYDFRSALIDIVGALAGVTEDLDNIKDSCDSQSGAALLSRVDQIHADLDLWHKCFLRWMNLCIPWPEADRPPDYKDIRCFGGLQQGAQPMVNETAQRHAMIDFWATRMIAHSLTSNMSKAMALPQSLRRAISANGPDVSLEAVQTQLAANIYEAAQPTIADECGLFGMLCSAWGLRNAFTAVKEFRTPRATELTKSLESSLAYLGLRDFRQAPDLIKVPRTKAIENSYAASPLLSDSQETVQLPEVLARSPV